MYALVIKGKRTLYLDEEKISNWEERKGETLIDPGFVSDVSIERVSYNRYELEAAAKALMVSNAINGLFADVRYSIIEVPEINIERELTVNAMLGAAELEPDKERKRKLAEQAIVDGVYSNNGCDLFGNVIQLNADISANSLRSNESVDFIVASDEASKWLNKKVKVTIETVD